MSVFDAGLLQENTYSKLADFNAEISEVCLNYSLYQHELNNLIKEKTCFKTLRISVAQIFSWQIFYPINILKQFQTFITFSWVRLGYLKTAWNLEKQTSYKNFDSDLKNAHSHETIESWVKSDKLFMKY